jgi:hypothetical protein
MCSDAVLARRAHEPWYADAVAALHAEAASPEELERFRWLAAPLRYGALERGGSQAGGGRAPSIRPGGFRRVLCRLRGGSHASEADGGTDGAGAAGGG